MPDDITHDTPLVALRGIWKVFEGVSVLRGIDFDIPAGEAYALLGGNGSGKSTIVKMFSGAYRPTADIIEVSGAAQSFSRPSEAHTQGINMVPQEPQVFANLSVRVRWRWAKSSAST